MRDYKISKSFLHIWKALDTSYLGCKFRVEKLVSLCNSLSCTTHTHTHTHTHIYRNKSVVLVACWSHPHPCCLKFHLFHLISLLHAIWNTVLENWIPWHLHFKHSNVFYCVVYSVYGTGAASAHVCQINLFIHSFIHFQDSSSKDLKTFLKSSKGFFKFLSKRFVLCKNLFLDVLK
jgi:hypothetical protein